MERKVPMRQCVACRAMKEKRELIRIVKSEDGISVDKTGKKNGRGAYVCKDKNCVDKLKKQKILSRVFSTSVDDAVYDGISEEIFGE